MLSTMDLRWCVFIECFSSPIKLRCIYMGKYLECDYNRIDVISRCYVCGWITFCSVFSCVWVFSFFSFSTSLSSIKNIKSTIFNLFKYTLLLDSQSNSSNLKMQTQYSHKCVVKWGDRCRSMVWVWFFDVILCFVVLLVEEVAEILGWEGDDVGWVLLDDCLRVVFEDVGQLFGHYDLFCWVDSLFSDVCHCETYFKYILTLLYRIIQYL